MNHVGEFINDSYGYIENLLKTIQCPICLDTLKKPLISNCGHKFCQECFRKAMKRKGQMPCPICKNAIKKRDMKESDRFNLILRTCLETVDTFQIEMDNYKTQQCYQANDSADFGQEKTPTIQLHTDGRMHMKQPKPSSESAVANKDFGPALKKYGRASNTSKAKSIKLVPPGPCPEGNITYKRKRGRPRKTKSLDLKTNQVPVLTLIEQSREKEEPTPDTEVKLVKEHKQTLNDPHMLPVPDIVQESTIPKSTTTPSKKQKKLAIVHKPKEPQVKPPVGNDWPKYTAKPNADVLSPPIGRDVSNINKDAKETAPLLPSWIESAKGKEECASSVHEDICNNNEMLESEIFSEGETCPKKLFFSSPSGENKLRITAVKEAGSQKRKRLYKNLTNDAEDGDYIPSSWPGAAPKHKLHQPVVLLKKLSSTDITKEVTNDEETADMVQGHFSNPIILPCTPIATTDDEEVIKEMEKNKMSFADPLIKTVTSAAPLSSRGVKVDFTRNTQEMKKRNKQAQHAALNEVNVSLPPPPLNEIPETLLSSAVPASWDEKDSSNQGLLGHFIEMRSTPQSPSVVDDSSADETICEEEPHYVHITKVKHTCPVLSAEESQSAVLAIHLDSSPNTQTQSPMKEAKSIATSPMQIDDERTTSVDKNIELLKKLTDLEIKKKLEAQIEILKLDFELKCKNMKFELEKMKQKYQNRSEYDMLKIENVRLNDEHSCLQKENEKMKQNYENRRLSYDMLKIEHERLKSDHSHLQKENEKMKQNYEMKFQSLQLLLIQESNKKFKTFEADMEKMKAFKMETENKFKEMSTCHNVPIMLGIKSTEPEDNKPAGQTEPEAHNHELDTDTDKTFDKSLSQIEEVNEMQSLNISTSTVLKVVEQEGDKQPDEDILDDDDHQQSTATTIPDTQDDTNVKTVIPADVDKTEDKEKTPDEKEMELLNSENANTDVDYEEHDTIDCSPLLYEAPDTNVEKGTGEQSNKDAVVLDEQSVKEQKDSSSNEEAAPDQAEVPTNEEEETELELEEGEIEDEFFQARDQISPSPAKDNVKKTNSETSSSQTQKVAISSNETIDVEAVTQPPNNDDNQMDIDPQINAEDSVSMSGEQDMVYITSGLQKIQISAVHKLAKKLDAKVVPVFDMATVTHVIVNTDENMRCDRTLKYLQGVAGRKWVVSFSWVARSLKQRCRLPEIEFEVRGDNSTDDSSLDHRPSPLSPLQSRIRQDRDGLFIDYRVMVLPPIARMSVEQLVELLELCGATVVNSLNDLTANDKLQSVIVADGDAENTQVPDYGGLALKYNCHVLSCDWVIESIGSYHLQPMETHDMLLTADFSEFISPQRP